ncbi:MAG: response regulator transcription factor [Lachnospiraceae bacterium]|nr:response regulator transcription factor [Lachnospiraceae bacterium]
MDRKTRVVVADDQNISRAFFEMYVRAAVGYELVAGLRTAREAVDFLETREADLLILDIVMEDGIDGLTAARMIKEKHPQVKIILTTSTAETDWEDKARSIGVESFWYKEYDERGIREIMDRTMQGESVYPGDPPKTDHGSGVWDDLSAPERDVLQDLVGGLTNSEIAEHLQMPENMVKIHLKSILEKTGYTDRLDLIMNVGNPQNIRRKEENNEDK